MFVAVHELAHIASASIGHTDEFWTNFKFLLEEAEKLNIYKPIDYIKSNMIYRIYYRLNHPLRCLQAVINMMRISLYQLIHRFLRCVK